MYNSYANPIITNCTFSGNKGYAIWNDFSNPVITNCIVYGNYGGIENSTGSTSGVVNNSIIQGGSYTTNGNINVDPDFTNAPAYTNAPFNNGNYQLQSISPAINLGYNPSIPDILSDIGGNIRIQGCTVDMGAYEFADNSAPHVLYVDSSISISNGDGLNWNTAFQTLSQAMKKALTCGNVDSILIAKGTYYPAGTLGNTINAKDSSFTILRGNLKIYGGYPSGGGVRDLANNRVCLEGAHNAYRVFLIAGLSTEADSVVLDGLVMQDAFGVTTSIKVYNSQNINFSNGGGISIFNNGNGGRVSIRNCAFNDNTVTNMGGGVYVTGSSPYFFNCNFNGDTSTSYYGGGMASDVSGSILDNCNFNANFAGVCGGGLYTFYQNTQVTNCTFLNNQAGTGAGMMVSGSSPLILNDSFIGNKAVYGAGIDMGTQTETEPVLPLVKNCVFILNSATAEGAGIVTDGSHVTPTITDCKFLNNTQGGAIYNTTNSMPLITHCIISGNYNATLAGGISNSIGSTPVIENCVISGNRGSHGGGMYNDEDYSGLNITKINLCTIAGNSDSFGGGGIYNGDGQVYPTVTNSIISGNSSGIYNYWTYYGYSTPALYSLVQDADPNILGSGSIDTTPLFVLPVSSNLAPTIDGDYRLQSTSPAINTGNNDSIPSTVLTDMDGNGRIYGNTVDMGAYEYGSSPLSMQLINFKGNLQQNNTVFLNWNYNSDQGESDIYLQRSADALNYTTIYDVKPNKPGLNVYSYVDHQPEPINYYRLMIDNNAGEFKYSNIVNINLKNIKSRSFVYPNPSKGLLNITIGDNSLLNSTMILSDVIGKVVYHQVITQNILSISLSDLNAGIYFLKLANGENFRIVKK
jgi:hypothetical protein